MVRQVFDPESQTEGLTISFVVENNHPERSRRVIVGYGRSQKAGFIN